MNNYTFYNFNFQIYISRTRYTSYISKRLILFCILRCSATLPRLNIIFVCNSYIFIAISWYPNQDALPSGYKTGSTSATFFNNSPGHPSLTLHNWSSAPRSTSWTPFTMCLLFIKRLKYLNASCFENGGTLTLCLEKFTRLLTSFVFPPYFAVVAASTKPFFGFAAGFSPIKSNIWNGRVPLKLLGHNFWCLYAWSIANTMHQFHR